MSNFISTPAAASHQPNRSGQVQAQFAIPGLNERVRSLSPGMIYGVAVDQQSLRVPLFAESVRASLDAGCPVVLLSPSEPASLIRKAALAGVDLTLALKTGQLRLFKHRVDAAKHVFQAGPEKLVRELAKYTVGPKSLIVFDQADPFFMLADPRQALEASALYARWAEEHEHTLLAMFAPAAQAPRDYITLRTIAESFAGFAVVKGGDEMSALELRHWFGALGASPRALFHLNFDDDGRLHVVNQGQGAGASVAASEEKQLATREAIDDFASEARRWKSVPSLMDALDGARNMKAGTVLLHFARTQEFRSLCQVVAAIRSLNRPQLRIVVRETKASLRLTHMLALLKLGVSLTISRHTPAAQVQLTMDSLRGTQLAREVANDVERTIRETTASFAKPIVEFDGFCDLVEKSISVSEEANIPHTLVRLGLHSIDGDRLAAIATRRGARDALFSVHDDSLWIFLFGCTAADSESVLARLLGKNFERLFMGFSRVEGQAEILRLLAGLANLDPDTYVLIGEAIQSGKVSVLPIAAMK